MKKSTKKKLYNWWINADFSCVVPYALLASAVVLAVLDAVDSYTPHYRMWAVGCAAAMLFYAIHAVPRP